MNTFHLSLSVFIILLMITLVLGFLGRKEDTFGRTHIAAFFYRCGRYLTGKKPVRKLYSEKIKGVLFLIHPARDVSVIIRDYYSEKLGQTIMLLIACSFLSVIVSLNYERESILKDGKLMRGDYTDDNTEVSLVVTDENDQDRILDYELLSRTYNDDELDKMASELMDDIESLILGDNESLEKIMYPLILRSGYGDYPFQIDWESSDYSLVDSDGSLKNDDLSSQRSVTLSAHLTYRDSEWIKEFPILVQKKPENDIEKWLRTARSELTALDKKHQTDESLILPDRIAGHKVSWSLKESISGLLLLPGSFLIAVLYYLLKDRELEDALRKKRAAVESAYPEFVEKFVLLFGAGLSVRQILFRISEGDINKDLCVELKVLIRDLGNGILEKDAIERFGRRLKSPLYIKFCSLLIGNLKKGNTELLNLLKEEAENAFTYRKNRARKLGEEAGTKLLFPMIMMLSVVMTVIIMPAFMSF